MNTNLETNWLEEATADLLAWRSSAGAWPYYQDREEATEPTCLAAFALSRNEQSKPSVDLAPTAQWLSLTQRADGAIGISRKMPVPAWPTSMAVLTWRLLKVEEAGQEKAIRWLLGARGTTTPRDTSAKPIVGHDTTIVGWPWVPDTHSWIEPTALTMLALRTIRLLALRSASPMVFASSLIVRFHRAVGTMATPKSLATNCDRIPHPLVWFFSHSPVCRQTSNGISIS